LLQPPSLSLSLSCSADTPPSTPTCVTATSDCYYQARTHLGASEMPRARSDFFDRTTHSGITMKSGSGNEKFCTCRPRQRQTIGVEKK
jgi:hypothetical protein